MFYDLHTYMRLLPVFLSWQDEGEQQQDEGEQQQDEGEALVEGEQQDEGEQQAAWGLRRGVASDREDSFLLLWTAKRNWQQNQSKIVSIKI